MDSELNVSHQKILIGGRPVPAELSILRQRAQDKHLKKTGFIDRKDWLKAENKAIYWPSVSTVISTSWRNDSDRIPASIQTIASADVLGTRAQLTTNASLEEGINDLRLEFRRTELNEGMPYSSFSAGDVKGFRTVNGAGSQRGLGMTLINRPLDAQRIFGNEDFSGDGPPGWEAELYRANALVEFKTIGLNGRYTFENIDLAGGPNDIKVVLYGPQGQTQVVKTKIFADSNTPSKGNLWYSLSGQQEGKTLLGFNEGLEDDNDTDFTDGRPQYRIVAHALYGVSNEFALSSGLSRAPSDDGDLNFVHFGLRSILLDNPFSLDFTQGFDDATGQALRLSTRTSVYGVNLSANHDEYHNFIGEQNTRDSYYLTRRTSFFVSSPTFGFEGWDEKEWSVGNTVNFHRRQYTDRAINWQISPRTWLSTSYGTITNGLSLNFDQDPGEPIKKSVSGTVSSTQNFENFSIRSRLKYDLEPSAALDSASLYVSTRHNEGHTVFAKMTRDLNDSGIIGLSVGTQNRFDFGDLGLSVAADSENNMSAAMTVSFGLQRNPSNGATNILPTSSLEGGVVLGRVFADKNDNQKFDEGDQLLEKVTVQTRQKSARTLKNGLAYLPALPVHSPIEIYLDPKSVEDPYLSNIEKKKTVILKNGSILYVDFPLLPSGEIEGKVYISEIYTDGTDFQMPVSNVWIELLDVDGKIVTHTQSIFDGSYVFTGVPIGGYSVRIAGKSLHRIGAVLGEPKRSTVITLKEPGEIKYVPDTTLKYSNFTSRSPVQRPKGRSKNTSIRQPQQDPLFQVPDDLKSWWTL